MSLATSEPYELLPRVYKPGQSYEDYSNACRSVRGLESIDDHTLEQVWKNLDTVHIRNLEAEKKVEEDFLSQDPSEHTACWMIDTEPPARDFLVDPIIPFVPVGIVAAAGGTGKSFFCLQLAAALASGKNFMGYSVPYDAIGKTVIFNCEDDTTEVHRRLKAIHAADPSVFSYPETLDKIIVPPVDHAQDFFLYSSKRPEMSKTDQIIKYLKKIENLKLVVFDPANIIFEGDSKDENEVSRFFKHLYKIHNEVGCMVLVLNHTNKASKGDKVNLAEQVMGSVAWVNRSRLVINLRYQDSIVEGSITKCNYLSRDDRNFKMEYVREGQGVLQPFTGSTNFSISDMEKNQMENFKEYFDLIDAHLNFPVDSILTLAAERRVGSKKSFTTVLDLIATGSFSAYSIYTRDEKRFIRKTELKAEGQD